MKRLCATSVLLWCSRSGCLLRSTTEGPVWPVTLIRVKPNPMDEDLSSLRQSSQPFLEEEKRQGLIVDHKLFFKETQHTPDDWNLCLAVEYKNHAAMDGLDAKVEAIRDKVLGGATACGETSGVSRNPQLGGVG